MGIYVILWMTKLYNEDTITAIATPGGAGAVSIIRISGPDSFNVANQIFKGKADLLNEPSHTIHYGKIFNHQELIDDVLIFLYRSPNSYTGEDSIEISTHGSPLITQKIIELLLTYDVRLADPGEFTRRAFMNGKIDLAQAEAVADIINSRTEASLRGARSQLDGLLSSKVEYLRNSLINVLSLVELELDFAEEDIEFLSRSEIRTKVQEIIKEIETLLNTYNFGRVIRDGVNVALVGMPNVGKSSLLNYFLKENRAIVSEIPGTTRDIIREDLTYEGILFKLYDTAGIRLTEDAVEQEGVLRSRKTVQEADLVIFISDVQQGISDELFSQLLSLTSEERIIRVLNKIDLESNGLSEKADVSISSKTGKGIDELLNLLKYKSAGSSSYSEKSAIVTNARHFSALTKSKVRLLDVLNSLNHSLSGEFISVDLRNAESSLSEIIGKITTDDILNNIFSKFCIGK